MKPSAPAAHPTAAVGVPVRVVEPDGAESEYFDLPADEPTLLRLFTLLFERRIAELTFGPCIQGAVFEIRSDKPAKVTMLDGYLTADFGSWHLHLCIGPTKGMPGRPTPAQLAAHRQAGRAVLFRTRNKSCVPASWGLRMWNGRGEQMITVFFPSPYLNDKMHRRREPDWSKLALWDELRREFLGLDPDPADRAAPECA